eukprot:7391679-Prymnesium_polylepis.1
MSCGAHAAFMADRSASQSLLVARRASMSSPFVDWLSSGLSGGTRGHLPAPRSMPRAHSSSTATLAASSGQVGDAASDGAGTTGEASNTPDDDCIPSAIPVQSCTSRSRGCTLRRSSNAHVSGVSTLNVGTGTLLQHTVEAADDAPAAPE